MSAFDVLDKFGTAALLKFFAAVAAFVLLHVLRIPIFLLAKLLEIGMVRIDRHLAGSIAAAPPTRPHNDFFASRTAA